MVLAKRVQQLPAYLFAQISKKVAQKRAEGIDCVKLKGVRKPGEIDVAVGSRERVHDWTVENHHFQGNRR